MAVLTHGTWVLVADGEKALILVNTVDAADPALQVVRVEAQEADATPRPSESPGSMSDAGPGQRSSVDEGDWHRLAQDRFAHDLADLLYKQAHRGAFDRLVLVAPGRVLGALRETLHKEVSAKVVAELDKTLTNHPIDKIERLLHGELDGA